jgi:hypothetical protein
MTPGEKVAFINSQVACALIEMESMKAANRDRQSRGESDAYGEEAFMNIINEHRIGWNDVIGYLRT